MQLAKLVLQCNDSFYYLRSRLRTRYSVNSITGRAPGKLVLSGDYIALLDAPALVLAVNCLASATLTNKSAGGWSVRSNVTPPVQFESLIALSDTVDQQMLKTLIEALPDTSKLPKHAELTLDTSAFYQGNEKLGVGSSAAILVALAEVLSQATDHPYSTESLIGLHNSLHGKNGSGLDIVAARIGGLTRFRNGSGVPVTLPAGLHMRFVFTGTSTSTEPMLARFRALVAARTTEKISIWQNLASAVAESLHDVALFLNNLAELNEFVLEFDRTTQLGIYGKAHHTALKIASDVGVLYKPCGAGGGDTGVALSDDSKALDAFEQNVKRAGLTLLNLKIENHGATVEL